MNKIEYKPIGGFEDYLIYNDGRVFTLKRNKFLKLSLNNGYHRITLYKNGKYHQVSVHRLVAKYFISNPQNKPFINHKDGNRSNNSLDNLEWCTSSENNKHAYVAGLRTWESESRQKVSKTLGSYPFKVYKKGQLVGVFPTQMSCQREIGVHNRNIGKCLKGINKQDSGFTFERISWKEFQNLKQSK